MGNPYPANFETLEGARRLTGQVDFTDGANQPGGFTPVSCLLARDAPFDIRQDAASTSVLWDALYDNLWDFNPLASIPAGLGLTFAFDGSASLIVPTEAGTWALSYFATRGADDTWSGSFAVGGVGLNFPWVQQLLGGLAAGDPLVAASLTAPLPAGTQLTHEVATTHEANANPYTCSQVYLAIVRLA